MTCVIQARLDDGVAVTFVSDLVQTTQLKVSVSYPAKIYAPLILTPATDRQPSFTKYTPASAIFQAL
jgi:hypothetical protein